MCGSPSKVEFSFGLKQEDLSVVWIRRALRKGAPTGLCSKLMLSISVPVIIIYWTVGNNNNHNFKACFFTNISHLFFSLKEKKVLVNVEQHFSTLDSD